MAGILTGGVIGSAIALLYAPKKGKHLRADISQKAGELKDGAEEMLSEAKDTASTVVHDLSRSAKSVVDNAKKLTDRIH
jgi:gas vesicle protein